MEKPTLFNILQDAQDSGLVGEETTALTVFSAMISGGFVVMLGPSRVGKTYTVTRMEEVMPDADVYEMSTTLSPTALYYAADDINACRVHIYPDLATMPEHVEAVLKANAEGLPATREVTDVASGDTVRMTINPPDCIIAGVASDNESIDLNDFPELRNRGLIVTCDASKEQTSRILDSQADAMSGLKTQQLTDEQRSHIKAYIRGIPVSRYARDDSIGSILNIPGGRPLRNQEPVPEHFTEARDDFKRLNNFIQSIALFHHEDRMELLLNGEPTLLVAPADVWHGMRIFGEQMIMSALNLRELDRVMLRFLREEKSALTVSKIQAAIRQEGAGYNVSDRDVQSALKSMKNKAYVDVNQADNPQTWYATPFASVTDHPTAISYADLVKDTEDIAREVLDAGDAEEYISRYCRGDGLIVTDPINGESVNILEDDTFEQEIEEATSELDEVMETPLWGDNSDDGAVLAESEAEEDEPDESLAFQTVDGSESGQGTLR